MKLAPVYQFHLDHALFLYTPEASNPIIHVLHCAVSIFFDSLGGCQVNGCQLNDGKVCRERGEGRRKRYVEIGLLGYYFDIDKGDGVVFHRQDHVCT